MTALTPRFPLSANSLSTTLHDMQLIAQTEYADVWKYTGNQHHIFRFAVCFGPEMTFWFDFVGYGIEDMQSQLLGHVPDEHWDQLHAIFALYDLG